MFLNSDIMRPSKDLGYEWVPNSKNEWFKINSLGMLDRARSEYKAKGVYRIICLGDSTTANSDYVRILEDLLNEYNNKGKFEVWNCAVTGYAAIQYCRALKEKWIGYDPDMVIIGFCLNDVCPTPLLVREGDNFVGYFPHREVLPKLSPFLLRHCALYRFMVIKLFFSGNKDYDDYRKNIIASTNSHLRETKEMLSKKKIPFLIVILGVTEPFQRCSVNIKETYEFIKESVRKYGIESLDIVPLFQENNPKTLQENDALHFNQKGSQLVANAIYAYLMDNLNVHNNDGKK